MSDGGVHYSVYPWEGKVVFKANIIEVSVVDADSPFPIFLEATTTFANQSRYSTSLINSADSNVSTSS